jgi:hypothetical protein
MPRSFNPNSEAGRRLEVVGQASCLSSAGVAVAGDFFPESFTSADRLACGSEQPTARREACPTTRDRFSFGVRAEAATSFGPEMLALLAKKLGAPKGAGRIKMSWWPAGLANDLAWLAATHLDVRRHRNSNSHLKRCG